MSEQAPSAESNEAFEARLVGPLSAVDAENLTARDSLEVAVSRFMDECRTGRTPIVADFARQYPKLEAELRELLPLIESLEQWGVDQEIASVRSNFPDDFRGREFGDYRIVREIGRGGMGIVFEAMHSQTSRPVAIKLLPLRFVTDLARRKEHLRREATTIAKLRHRNIVPVYSFGSQQGYYYYVMQLVEGASLDVVIRRLRESSEIIHGESLIPTGHSAERPADAPVDLKPFHLARDSWKAFAQIGLQVAHALAYAHQHGVLHNDIKPANLLLDRWGRVVVTDFGVGWGLDLSDGSERGTGTLRYMAPERFLGQCDERSDVYSLGATLYELLTQSPVYPTTDRRQLIEHVLQTPPRPLTQVNPRIPVALDLIVHKALAKQPEDRFGSANELGAELLRFINDRPILTRAPSLLMRLRKWWHSRRSRTSAVPQATR